MEEGALQAGLQLNRLLAEAGVDGLKTGQTAEFGSYLLLLLRWNAHINITGIRDTEGILARHFVESIRCARALPSGIVTLLDFGSGAGLPGIPVALCRPEIEVTLAESQGKKAGFLNEAIRVLGISAKVHAGRAEDLRAQFDCVTLRAVDRMGEAVGAASRLVAARGWLALMTTDAEVGSLKAAAGKEYSWERPAVELGGDHRVLALGERISWPA